MKVQKLLKTCNICGGQLQFLGNLKVDKKLRACYKCKNCSATVDSNIKMENAKK